MAGNDFEDFLIFFNRLFDFAAFGQGVSLIVECGWILFSAKILQRRFIISLPVLAGGFPLRIGKFLLCRLVILPVECL